MVSTDALTPVCLVPPSPWLCTGLPPVWWDSVTTSCFVLLWSTNSSDCKLTDQILHTETCCRHSSLNTASNFTELCEYTVDTSHSFLVLRSMSFSERSDLINLSRPWVWAYRLHSRSCYLNECKYMMSCTWNQFTVQQTVSERLDVQLVTMFADTLDWSSNWLIDLVYQ